MSKPSAYVASRFGDYERVRRWNDELTLLGYRVTYDWTRSDEFGTDGHPCKGDLGDKPLTAVERERYAALDYFGATEADTLIFFGDQDNYTGALIEVGLALASGAEVLVVSPTKDSIFWDLPRVTIVGSEEELHQHLFWGDKIAVGHTLQS